ncbi:MAG: 2'-5' RNA ligase family protein [Ferruginibacter sp.]
MKTLSKQPSDYNLSDFGQHFEYLLIFSPDGEAYKLTNNGKQTFYKNYRNEAAIFGKPHITLANFLQPDLFEEEIINKLRRIAENSNAIKIILKDYDWLPNTNKGGGAIVFNVEHKIDTQQLVRKITSGIKRLMILENKLGPEMKQKLAPRFVLNPHLTLCKGLTPEQFAQSKIEYATKRFYAEFAAKEMMLIKRLGTNAYQEVERCKLNGPGILTITKQGNLFQ